MVDSIQTMLNKIQKDLRVPKEQYNSFAKFHYRSCEDILEGIKKVMPDNVALTIEDEILMIGDRYYIKATAIFSYKDKEMRVSAYAREPLEKKGADPAQITGATSSYARKYALNGLFLIDDSKDADSKDNRNCMSENLLPLTERSSANLIEFTIKSKNIPAETVQKMKAFAGVENFHDAPEDKLKVILERIGGSK